MKVLALALLLSCAALPCAAQLIDVQHPDQQQPANGQQTGGQQSGAQPAQPQQASPAAVTSAQQVIQQVATGQFDKVEAQYNARLAAALQPGKLAQAWASLLEQAGSFDSVASVRSGKVQGYDVVILACKFQKGLVDAQIAFDVEGKIAGLRFTGHQEPVPPWVEPSYAKPDSFSEQPLTLVNGAFELPGTLTVPKGDGPFPAAVLISGSGPHDEDETIGPNKVLKDLAWGLASHGVAVFRYTKRTEKYGEKSNADPAKLTVDDETISDARAAVALLAKQQKIDPKHIYIVGHSLGAYLVPRIATGDTEIAGIVMLAANTRPMEQLLVDEIRYLINLGGPSHPPTADEQKQLTTVEDSEKQIESPDLKPGDTVQVLGGTMPASYWLDLRNYHPVEVAKDLRIPILVLQGARDFQVPPDSNFAEWKSGLAGRRNVEFKLYPNLNHLFMAGSGPSLPKEYDTPGHVDEPVVVDIATWISAGGKLPQQTAASGAN